MEVKMREIKFRAWDKSCNKMLDVYNCDFSNEELICTINKELICIMNIKRRFHEVILMQYTGLKDCNDIDIYENDIVKFSVFDYEDIDTQYVGVIKWQGSRFTIWNNENCEFYGSDGAFDLDWVLSQDDGFEVKGNIYQNSELLHPIDGLQPILNKLGEI